MTKTELIKYIAQSIGYWDHTNSIVLTGKDITEAMMLDALNFRYLEDAFPRIAEVKPEYFEQEALTNNYNNSSTVSSNVTTTLVSVDSIFTSGCVNAKVYNSTAEETATITGYTSGTTVTLDSSYSWTAADTIYLITGIYTFGSDATDILGYPSYVGIKYDSDDDFTKVSLYGANKAFEDSYGKDKFNTFTETNPIYTITTVDVSGVFTSAIAIKPIPDENIANGVFIRYIEKPAALSSGSDVPRLPLGYHKFIADGAIADLLDQVVNDHTKSDRYLMRYERTLEKLIESALAFDTDYENFTIEQTVNYFRSRKY
jgi:hypothetical protein